MRRHQTRTHLDFTSEGPGVARPADPRGLRHLLHAPGEAPEHTHRRVRHAAQQHLRDVTRGADPNEDALLD